MNNNAIILWSFYWYSGNFALISLAFTFENTVLEGPNVKRGMRRVRATKAWGRNFFGVDACHSAPEIGGDDRLKRWSDTIPTNYQATIRVSIPWSSAFDLTYKSLYLHV